MSFGVFGIRHHGPGSARSVVRALAAFEPDIVLVEGPPEADGIVAHARDEAMKPPVAILAYALDDPKRCLFYPFALFSPEWQAIGFALERELPVRFIDLPIANVLAAKPPQIERGAAPGIAGDGEDDADAEDDERADRDDGEPFRDDDPLQAIAEAAGYTDGERWWDRFVERAGTDADAFAAIEELMSVTRSTRLADAETELREAAMRQAIRAARKEFGRVAVVCGAYHAPALRDARPAAADAKLLRALPKTKVAATWIPWTNGRLGYESGYGAGVESPGWYEHLWQTPSDGVVTGWMAKAARTLRAGGIDVASAHAIEATRLADALAALREAPVPGLDDLTDAIVSIYCFGNTLPLELLREKLIVGERLGVVPESVTKIPLLADFEREVKRLRWPAAVGDLDLDLRKPTDLDRSRLLHRLRLLGVPWGRVSQARSSTGTFRESWQLRWDPVYNVALIENSIYGNTIREAASGRVRERAAKATATALPELTGLLSVALYAGIADALDAVLAAVRDRAAETHDVPLLLDAIPALAQIRRYGDVRKTDIEHVGAVLSGLLARACIGLPSACLALDDDAAEKMYGRMVAVDTAVRTLDDAGERAMWYDALRKVAGSGRVHGVVAGRATRILLDARIVDRDRFGTELGLALGRANAPADAAAWIDGAFRKSGLVIVHEPVLLEALDRWLTSLDPETFVEMLPLVRRTFGTFESPERAAIGDRIAKTGGNAASAAGADYADDLVWERARALVPVLAELLGMP